MEGDITKGEDLTSTKISVWNVDDKWIYKNMYAI